MRDEGGWCTQCQLEHGLFIPMALDFCEGIGPRCRKGGVGEPVRHRDRPLSPNGSLCWLRCSTTGILRGAAPKAINYRMATKSEKRHGELPNSEHLQDFTGMGY